MRLGLNHRHYAALSRRKMQIVFVSVGFLFLLILLAVYLGLSPRVEIKENTACLIQQNARLKERVAWSAEYDQVDEFYGQRTALGAAVVVTILRNHGVKYRNESQGHHASEMLSLELTREQFGAMSAPVFFNAQAKPALTATTKGFYRSFSYPKVEWTPTRKSWLSLDGKTLTGQLFVQSPVGVGAEVDMHRFEIPVSCSIQNVAVADMNKCMGAEPADFFASDCPVYEKFPHTRRRVSQICWNYPEGCKDFLAQEAGFETDILTPPKFRRID